MCVCVWVCDPNPPYPNVDLNFLYAICQPLFSLQFIYLPGMVLSTACHMSAQPLASREVRVCTWCSTGYLWWLKL